MEESHDNHIRIEPQINRKVHIRASEIIKKFRTFHDRQAFCKENSKSTFLIFRFIFSQRKWIRFHLLFKVLTRR